MRLRKCEFIERTRARAENNCQKARPRCSFNANARNWKFTQIKCTQFNNKLPRGFAFIVVLLLRFTCRCRYIFLCRKCFSQRAHILYFNVYEYVFTYMYRGDTRHSTTRWRWWWPLVYYFENAMFAKYYKRAQCMRIACMCGHGRIWKGPHFFIF